MRSALGHLERKDFDAARRTLGACIVLADLPDCHLHLSTVLRLSDHPAGVEHMKVYVETSTTTKRAL